MKKLVPFYLLFCLGCTSATKKNIIHISLVYNNSSLKVQGIDAAVLGAIQRDFIPGVWQTLLPVYRMPADTDMKDYQPPQLGIYQVENNAVLFTPDTPFIKGKTYFLRYYRFDEGKSIFDMIKNKRKLGSQAYSDFVFKKVHGS